MDEQKKSKSGHRLARAIRDVRIGDIEQNGVIVELGDTERARLELLQEALNDVAAELPEDMDMLALQIVPGRKPRFWIDVTSFVEMGRDKRSFRFLKDTRLGRVTLAETTNIEQMADHVTHYLAERIVEREKAMEGDYLISKLSRSALGDDVAKAADVKSVNRESQSSGAVWWFLLGVLIGAIGLVLYAWFMPTNF